MNNKGSGLKVTSQSKCPIARAIKLLKGEKSFTLAAMQGLVHETILQVGGYFSPLSGVARLLEEVGELSEAIYSAADSTKVSVHSLPSLSPPD